MITFGTDGIRGIYGMAPLVPDALLLMGFSIGLFLKEKSCEAPKVLLGWDTRQSSPIMAQALASGLKEAGIHMIPVGIVPTPAVSFLASQLNADMGMMISASHNPAAYNGIKFFNDKGHKLSVGEEADLLHFINKPHPQKPKIPWHPLEDQSPWVSLYEDSIVSCIEEDLTGLKIVLDCAQGSFYDIAPRILRRLGAEVIAIGVTPNGENINDGSGALFPEMARTLLAQHNADLALTFDGDGDRLVAVESGGFIANGDQILACLALEEASEGIVGTVLSNFGLETFLAQHKKPFIRTAVGDRWIAQCLMENNWHVGGEACGHLIIRPYMATGDGLLVGLRLASIKARHKHTRLFPLFKVVPSVEATLPLIQKDFLDLPDVQNYIQSYQKKWEGRLVVRASGTEPIVRILVEGPCADQAEGLLCALKTFLAQTQRELGCPKVHE